MYSITKLCGILFKFATVILLIALHQRDSSGPGASCTRVSSIFNHPNYDEIESNLFLGNAKAACDPRILTHLKITHILTIDNEPIPKSILHQLNITNMFIRAGDSSEQQIIPYFPIANAFIDTALEEGSILVHCHHGISRSATLVIAYMMEKYDIPYERAFSYVRKKRSFIRPNPGFEEQLREYYAKNFVVDRISRLQAFRTAALKHKYKLASAAMVALCCVAIPLVIVV